MKHAKIARLLAGVGALGFFVAAVLHTSQYGNVVAQARQASVQVASLMAALWLAFAAAMLVLGIMVSVVARGRVSGARLILGAAACFPLATVLLQLRYLGFIPPVPILSTVAILTFAAAAMWPAAAEPAGDASKEG